MRQSWISSSFSRAEVNFSYETKPDEMLQRKFVIRHRPNENNQKD